MSYVCEDCDDCNHWKLEQSNENNNTACKIRQFDDTIKRGINNFLLLLIPLLLFFIRKQDFIGSSDPKNVKQLIKKQAEWCETTNDPKAAV